MISQPVSSISPCSSLPSGTWQTPGLSISWCFLPTSSSVCLVFFPLSLCLVRWFWPDLMNGRRVHATAVCIFLRRSGGLRVVRLPAGSWQRTFSLVTWSLYEMRIMLRRTSFPWLIFFFGALLWGSMIHKCTGRWMWQGSTQSYLGIERNTPVIPNWFQPCQCCCCQCYTGEYLRLGTLISCKWAQVLEVCDCLELLTTYFNLCVDATDVVCHQRGRHSTEVHAVSCRGRDHSDSKRGLRPCRVVVSNCNGLQEHHQLLFWSSFIMIWPASQLLCSFMLCFRGDPRLGPAVGSCGRRN